jgi:hypothetical protein
MAALSRVLAIGEHHIRQHGDLYSLNDLHRAAGGEVKHEPANFTRLETTQALIAEIQSAEMQSANSSEMRSALKTVNGGPHRGTYACRELVIAYAAWISAAFHLKVIRVFLASATPSGAPTPRALSLRDPPGGRIGVIRKIRCSVSIACIGHEGEYLDFFLQPRQLPFKAGDVVTMTFKPGEATHTHIDTAPLLSRRVITTADED